MFLCNMERGVFTVCVATSFNPIYLHGLYGQRILHKEKGAKMPTIELLNQHS